MPSLTKMVSASRKRLAKARAIADSFTPNSDMHKLAMKTVFILEDVHESLVGAREALGKSADNQHW